MKTCGANGGINNKGEPCKNYINLDLNGRCGFHPKLNSNNKQYISEEQGRAENGKSRNLSVYIEVLEKASKLGALVYFVLSLLGIYYAWAFISPFGINIFHYYDLTDFITAGVQSIIQISKYGSLQALTLFSLYLFYVSVIKRKKFNNIHIPSLTWLVLIVVLSVMNTAIRGYWDKEKLQNALANYYISDHKQIQIDEEKSFLTILYDSLNNLTDLNKAPESIQLASLSLSRGQIIKNNLIILAGIDDYLFTLQLPDKENISGKNWQDTQAIVIPVGQITELCTKEIKEELTEFSCTEDKVCLNQSCLNPTASDPGLEEHLSKHHMIAHQDSRLFDKLSDLELKKEQINQNLRTEINALHTVSIENQTILTQIMNESAIPSLKSLPGGDLAFRGCKYLQIDSNRHAFYFKKNGTEFPTDLDQENDRQDEIAFSIGHIIQDTHEYLKSNNHGFIYFVGRADKHGNNTYNLDLSEERAKNTSAVISSCLTVPFSNLSSPQEIGEKCLEFINPRIDAVPKRVNHLSQFIRYSGRGEGSTLPNEDPENENMRRVEVLTCNSEIQV